MAMKDHATTGGIRSAPPQTGGSPVPLIVVGGLLSCATVAWIALRPKKKRRRR